MKRSHLLLGTMILGLGAMTACGIFATSPRSTESDIASKIFKTPTVDVAENAMVPSIPARFGLQTLPSNTLFAAKFDAKRIKEESLNVVNLFYGKDVRQSQTWNTVIEYVDTALVKMNDELGANKISFLKSLPNQQAYIIAVPFTLPVRIEDQIAVAENARILATASEDVDVEEDEDDDFNFGNNEDVKIRQQSDVFANYALVIECDNNELPVTMMNEIIALVRANLLDEESETSPYRLTPRAAKGCKWIEFSGGKKVPQFVKSDSEVVIKTEGTLEEPFFICATGNKLLIGNVQPLRMLDVLSTPAKETLADIGITVPNGLIASVFNTRQTLKMYESFLTHQLAQCGEGDDFATTLQKRIIGYQQDGLEVLDAWLGINSMRSVTFASSFTVEKNTVYAGSFGSITFDSELTPGMRALLAPEIPLITPDFLDVDSYSAIMASVDISTFYSEFHKSLKPDWADALDNQLESFEDHVGKKLPELFDMFTGGFAVYSAIDGSANWVCFGIKDSHRIVEHLENAKVNQNRTDSIFIPYGDLWVKIPAKSYDNATFILKDNVAYIHFKKDKTLETIRESRKALDDTDDDFYELEEGVEDDLEENVVDNDKMPRSDSEITAALVAQGISLEPVAPSQQFAAHIAPYAHANFVQYVSVNAQQAQIKLVRNIFAEMENLPTYLRQLDVDDQYALLIRTAFSFIDQFTKIEMELTPNVVYGELNGNTYEVKNFVKTTIKPLPPKVESSEQTEIPETDTPKTK